VPIHDENIEHTIVDDMMNSTSKVNEMSIRDEPVSEQEPCPVNMKANENGICQSITSTSQVDESTEPEMNPKNIDECPPKYVKFDGACLYIKPQSKLSEFDDSPNDRLMANQARLNNIDGSIIESVPVLSDNSCPEGTEYSEHGICQKLVSVSQMKSNMKKAEVSCPANTRLIGDRCVSKRTKLTVRNPSSTTIETPIEINESIDMTTVSTDAVDMNTFVSTSEMTPESTTTAEVNMEVETTFQSDSHQ
jgi:hypothetical protein